MSKEPTVEVISLPMIQTRLAEDLIPPDKRKEIFAKLGMVPSSDDVSVMEQQASEARRQKLAPLLMSLDLFTQVASQIMQGAILLQEGKSVDSESSIPLSALTLANVAVTRTVIANLIDLGIITISGFTVEGSIS